MCDLPRFFGEGLQAILTAFSMTPCGRLSLGHVLSWIDIFHVPIETFTLQRLANVKTNRQIAWGHGSRVWSGSIVEIYKIKLDSFLSICERKISVSIFSTIFRKIAKITFIIIHPSMNKTVVIFDKDIISTFRAKVIWMIVAEDMTNLIL